jgi:hypothetical protein
MPIPQSTFDYGQIETNPEHVPVRSLATAKLFIGYPPLGEVRRLERQSLYTGGFKSTVTISGAVVAGDYTITLNDNDYTVSADGTETLAEVFEALYSAIAVSNLSFEMYDSTAKGETTIRVHNSQGDLANYGDRFFVTGDPTLYTIIDATSDRWTISPALSKRTGGGTGITVSPDQSVVFVSDTEIVLVGDVDFDIATSAPSGITLTASTVTGQATGAKGATTINLLFATTEEMQVGQWLQFVDSDRIEHVAKLSALAPIGSTTLYVEPLVEAIPAGSLCEFPLYVWSMVNLTAQPGRDIDNNSTHVTLQFSVFYTHKQASQLMLRDAADSSKVFIVEQAIDAPSPDYTQGGVVYFASTTNFPRERAGLHPLFGGDKIVALHDWQIQPVSSAQSIQPN